MNKKKKKGRGGNQNKRQSPFSTLNMSRIDQHKWSEGKLRPPLAQLPKLTPSSWADDHMPEMLWAVLLTRVLDREHYLGCFRRLAVLCRDWFKNDSSDEQETQAKDEDLALNFTVIIDHTKLVEIDEDKFAQFVAIPLSHPLGYAALRPLLLIESLPGLERWKRALAVDPVPSDWQTLGAAIAGVLDHQSQASTDIRWFKVILPTISGRMVYPESMADFLEELRLFPNKGDMRSVRPRIRSGEMVLRRNPPTAWVRAFWAQLMEQTTCSDPTSYGSSFAETSIDSRALYRVRYEIIEGFMSSMTAKRADARLDSAFGLVLYGLSIVEEISLHRVQLNIVGRLALRALVEANITLRYLAQRDDELLWKSYRVYGAGQAKLAFLKTQELEGNLPPFLDEAALHEIANEDIWQEFLDIDVGHWANSNLRKLAIECGAKDLYDRYYEWASAYAHSHWGAIRDTNFTTCHNPLHRLHRIPRLNHRILNSVEQDAVDLFNQMTHILNRLYFCESAIKDVSIVTGSKVTEDGANEGAGPTINFE